MTRRDFLQQGRNLPALAAAGSFAPSVLSGCGSSAGATPIKVGILHSQTGSMAISETALRDAELMAMEEINAAGGVLGRAIEPVIEDPRSRFTDLFPEKARRLPVEHKVAAVFGCWTSSSRKAVLPVFEEHNGLLFYPVQYEGNESSRNVIYTGAAPNQQIIPAIEWLLSPAGGSKKRFYPVGSDYLFPRTANFIIVKLFQSRGLQVAGENYTPMGHREYTQVIQDIKKADPDVIFNTINGDSNIAFYDAMAAQGITVDKIPIVATSVGEDELRSFLPSRVKGHLAAWNYFQSIDTTRNQEFVNRFRADRGHDRVSDDPIEAAYFQVYLWKLAVERAGSLEVDQVREAFRSGIEFEAPGGEVKVDPKAQHAYKRFRMGRVRDDRQFDIIYETPEWIEPDPYPQVAFPGWHCDWTQGGITRVPRSRSAPDRNEAWANGRRSADALARGVIPCAT
jgi:urea transport system substrate-binding protein